MKSKASKKPAKIGPKTIIAELVATVEKLRAFAPASEEGRAAEVALRHAKKFLARKPAKRHEAKRIAPKKIEKTTTVKTDVVAKFLDGCGRLVFEVVLANGALGVVSVCGPREVPMLIQPMGGSDHITIVRAMDYAARVRRDAMSKNQSRKPKTKKTK